MQVRLRLAGKLWFAPEEEKALRIRLGHEQSDFLSKAAERFHQLHQTGTADTLVQSTSARQAVPQLLKTLGLAFDGGPWATKS